MKPAKAAHIMPPLPKPLTLSRGDEDGAIQLGYTAEQMQAYARAAVEAALRDAPQQAEPNDAKDAARYRYLVVMETKAAPDTVAHYIRNPAHLDRVIEVMEQKP